MLLYLDLLHSIIF